MDLQKRIEAFSELGNILRGILDGRKMAYAEKLESLIENQHIINPWFTPANVRMALNSIAESLTEENLNKWIASYPDITNEYDPLNVGLIMAGNIPAVGFHDFLTVLISGNRVVAKTSSKDRDIIGLLGDILCSLNSEFAGRISFTDGFLTGFDIVIATGSDNSSRYFESYFGRYPHIIRKNRNSIAIIEGDENDSDLLKLGSDIFSYFGLGCRNISKVYVPSGYNFEKMIDSWFGFAEIVNHSKYANNYEYNKAVYLVNREKFLDSGYLLLRESKQISSPVAVLYFEHYNTAEELTAVIDLNREKIQCITGRKWIPFGKAQYPELWDYADNVDTLDFLLKKNMVGIL
jgi:hypothetical protein